MGFNNKTITGWSLSDGKAHAQDHFRRSRRDFLGKLGLMGGSSLLFHGFPLSVQSSNPLGFFLSQSACDHILLLIQLKGGNDGLNTLIPLYDYGYYSLLRPGIKIAEKDSIALSKESAIPKYMQGVHPLWEKGQMKALRSVGYPEQNLSHFRSTDIWTSASDAATNITTGWMGRWLETEYPDYIFSPPTIPPAIQIGGDGTLVFEAGEINMSVAVANPAEMYEIAKTGQLYDTLDVPATVYGEELRYIRSIANSTFVYAESIKKAYDEGINSFEYQDNDIAKQFALVARLIKGKLGTRIYMVSLDGFDTHANQPDWHPRLMRELSDAMNGFYKDLGQAGWDRQVMAMTFSEFGRRIEQNGSLGTDHGSAAPLLLFGSALEGNGFIGKIPDLRNPDPYGNLVHDLDFRSVYATVLERWMCIDAAQVDAILGDKLPRIESLLFNGTTPVDPVLDDGVSFRHEARYDSATGKTFVYFFLPRPGKVRLQVMDFQGKVLAELLNENLAAGEHIQNLSGFGTAAGMYFYRIEALGKVFTKSIRR